MHWTVNRGAAQSYGVLEKEWRDLLAADPTAKIEVDVFADYSGAGSVPEAIVVDYRIDGGRVIQQVFDNVP
jgi:hypothetical protein